MRLLRPSVLWQLNPLVVHLVNVPPDQPGYHFFGCPIMNHADRGMLGLILVKDDALAETRLDRPPQRRM